MKWLALLVAVGSIGGCEDKKAAEVDTPQRWEEGSQSKPTGPIYEDQDFVFSAQAVRNCSVTGPMAPQANFQRISVSVEVTAQTKREVPVAPLSFTLEDADGHRYRATLAGCAPNLPRKSLKSGEKLQGEVAFDVPQDLGATEITFEPFLIGRKKIVARAKLPEIEPTGKEKEPSQVKTAPSSNSQ